MVKNSLFLRLLIDVIAFLHGTCVMRWPWGAGWVHFFVWVGGVFVSLLIHEFGHALTGRAFGAESAIVLTPLYGLAVGSTDLYDRRKRMAVILAGPLAQLLLAGLLWLATYPILEWLPLQSEWVDMLLGVLILLTAMNVVWPLANLLPIPPLDGGRLALEVLSAYRSRGASPWEQDPDWWKRR